MSVKPEVFMAQFPLLFYFMFDFILFLVLFYFIFGFMFLRFGFFFNFVLLQNDNFDVEGEQNLACHIKK